MVGDIMLPWRTPHSCEYSVIWSDITFSPFLKKLFVAFCEPRNISTVGWFSQKIFTNIHLQPIQVICGAFTFLKPTIVFNNDLYWHHIKEGFLESAEIVWPNSWRLHNTKFLLPHWKRCRKTHKVEPTLVQCCPSVATQRLQQAQ